MRYLVDSNVLLRRMDADSPAHTICSEAVKSLLEAGEDLCVCAQVLIEFWVVSTRPKDVNGLGLPTAIASQQVTDYLQTFARLPELPDMAERWLAVAEEYAVQGKPAHDARIVALMLAHSVTHILTLNPKDFARYQGITPVTPHDILQQSDRT